METTLKIKTIKFAGNVIEFYTNGRNQICGRYSTIITRGKNKGSKKVLQNYFFGNEEKRNNWAESIVKSVTEANKKMTEAKEAKKSALQNVQNQFNVGDLFYHSWGWEQTNINFYQVIEVKKSSVVFRSIAQSVVAGSEGNMCERVTPVKDAFFAEGDYFNKIVTKRIKACVNANGVEYYVSEFRPYTQGEKGLYQSHYA